METPRRNLVARIIRTAGGCINLRMVRADVWEWWTDSMSIAFRHVTAHGKSGGRKVWVARVHGIGWTADLTGAHPTLTAAAVEAVNGHRIAGALCHLVASAALVPR